MAGEAGEHFTQKGPIWDSNLDPTCQQLYHRPEQGFPKCSHWKKSLLKAPSILWQGWFFKKLCLIRAQRKYVARLYSQGMSKVKQFIHHSIIKLFLSRRKSLVIAHPTENSPSAKHESVYCSKLQFKQPRGYFGFCVCGCRNNVS